MPFLPPQTRLALRFIGEWIVANLARFVMWTALTTMAFGAVVGAVTYLLVREETTTCQSVSWVVAAAGVLFFGAVAGGVLAAVRSLSGWVTDSSLGPMAGKAIFAETLGVSDKRPAGTTELAKSLNGATLGDAKLQLQDAFAGVFKSRSLDRWLPPTGRWLASRLLNGAGWVATRVALAQLPGDPNDATPLDLLALRDAVGNQIEQQAIRFVAWRARAFAWVVLSIGAGLTIGAVAFIAWAFAPSA